MHGAVGEAKWSGLAGGGQCGHDVRLRSGYGWSQGVATRRLARTCCPIVTVGVCFGHLRFNGGAWMAGTSPAMTVRVGRAYPVLPPSLATPSYHPALPHRLTTQSCHPARSIAQDGTDRNANLRCRDFLSALGTDATDLEEAALAVHDDAGAGV